MSATAAGAPAYVRWTNYATLALLFALPCLTGRLTTYFVMICALLVLITPSVVTAWRQASRNPVDLVFLGVVIALSIAFVVTAEDGSDISYILNFSPFLLAIPVRWQLERVARLDGAVIVGWLSLAGTVGALIVALIQVFMLGYARVGQPVLGIFQFADTVMLLGFMALVGWFAPGRQLRWPFLLGPLIGIVTVLLSGTRGALLAAPLLAVVAFGFALLTAKRKAPVIYAGIGAIVVLGLLVLIAPHLGFGRALDAFRVTSNAVIGGEMDSNSEERVQMLIGGWRAFLASPLFGYGWADMVPAIYPHVDPAYEPVMHGFRHLHNGLISFAVGAGIIGIISFLALSAIPVVAVFFTQRDSQFASRLYLALTMCAGYQVFQATFVMIGYEFGTVQYAFMTMAILAFMRDPVAAQSAAVGKAAVGSETMNSV